MNNDEIIHSFARRAPFFNNNGWANNEEILTTISNCVVEHCPDAKYILDFGAGTGKVSKYLLKTVSGDIQITALDISPEMLSRIDDNRIKCVVSSVEKTPFSDSCFDLIISRQCLHYVHKLTETLEEARRILREHGKFILTQFVPLEDETKQYWEKLTRIRQPLRINYFSEKEWIKCFEEAGFSVSDVRRFSILHSDNRIHNLNQFYNGWQKQDYLEKLMAAPDNYKQKYDIVVYEKEVTSRSFGITIVFDSP